MDASMLTCFMAIGAVFALVMSVMALRRIPRFDLADINKF